MQVPRLCVRGKVESRSVVRTTRISGGTSSALFLSLDLKKARMRGPGSKEAESVAVKMISDATNR